MDSVKTFFAGQYKDALSHNNQQRAAGRSMVQSGNSGVTGNPVAKIDHQDLKRKDSDSYFYIMWRS